MLGIQPRWAETGYGYIEFPDGVNRVPSSPTPVRSFREKPDLQTAMDFVKAGNFYWNAGMFFWKVFTVLDELRRHLPKTATLLGVPAALWKPPFPPGPPGRLPAL